MKDTPPLADAARGFLFRLRLSLVLLAASIALLPTSSAWPAPASEDAVAIAAARPAILPVDEIQPGMVGVGKTVFQGTRIEEFHVEIIGVLKRVSPNGDIIIGRASGGPLAQTGIIEGMSGSPVYIDGKLIGAVAYSWSFAKEPIAGITPIAEMLEVMERADLPPEEHAGASGLPGGALEVRVSDAGVADLEAGLPSNARLRAIRTPIVVSGFDPRVVEQLDAWFRGFGCAAMPGGGTVAAAEAASEAASEAARYEPEPGAAVGVQLLSGDAAITAIGTVTHREGDRIIAFGHPLFMAGDVDLPMTGAYVHGVLPSALSSFKMGSPLSPLGTLTQDRRTAISGNVGPSPETIPISVTIRAGGADHAYHYRAVRSDVLTPGLVQYSTVNSLIATEAFMSDETFDTRVVTRLSDGRRIALENRFAGPSTIEKVAEETAGPTAFLMQNRFEKVSIEGIDVQVAVTPGRSAGRLEAIRVSKNPVRPGETILVEASVKSHQGPLRVFPISIDIPSGAEEGEVMLRVCDAAGMAEAETKRAPQRLEWEDLDTFLAAVAERRRNDRLYAQLETPNVGVTIAGREFPSLPRSVFAVIDSDRHTENAGVASASVLAKGEVDAGLVVTGCKTIPVRIDRKAP